MDMADLHAGAALGLHQFGGMFGIFLADFRTGDHGDELAVLFLHGTCQAVGHLGNVAASGNDLTVFQRHDLTLTDGAAAEKVATGLITYAARDSEFDGKPIKKGEIMALENGKIVATGTDLVKMTYRLARSMKKKDTQFITVISGCDVSDEDAEKTTDLVRAKCGGSVEVSHISGGQPVYYYMISVE